MRPGAEMQKNPKMHLGVVWLIISSQNALHVHNNKATSCTSSAASNVESTEPPRNKNGYNRYNPTIIVLWI